MGNHCEMINTIVLSWIMNSIAKNLLGGIMYASSAQVVSDDLSERFNNVDGSRTFNLHKEIAILTQGAASVSVYYPKLKIFWEEFEALVPAPGCDREKSRDFVLYLQKLKLSQCLMGLNDSYSQARSEILMRSPSPTDNQAYAIIISDESQKSVAANSGILGNNQTITTGNYEIAMYSKTSGNQYQKFKKNYNIQREFCKLKGHNNENYYKIVGYPPNFKHKKKSSGGNYNANAVNPVTEIPNSACNGNVNALNMQIPNSQNVPAFQYGQNTNVNYNGFTNHDTGTDKKLLVLKDSQNGIDKSLLVSKDSQSWIVATGATNHMVSDIGMLNKSTIVEPENPKRISLPNGDTTLITHIGTSSISDTNTDLFIGRVKEIGKEDDSLYMLLAQRIHKNKRFTLVEK
ncbi:uncharacterized protein [Nicotiana sylvestris]|uniref:uncharacterized protein n=1 Tax=Nicotiana sylvestris TaxID=4096 RepID=UPI00388CB447